MAYGIRRALGSGFVVSWRCADIGSLSAFGFSAARLSPFNFHHAFVRQFHPFHPVRPSVHPFIRPNHALNQPIDTAHIVSHRNRHTQPKKSQHTHANMQTRKNTHVPRGSMQERERSSGPFFSPRGNPRNEQPRYPAALAFRFTSHHPSIHMV